MMSFISQKVKQKPTYTEILIQKVKALRELQVENQTHLTYVEAQFLVNQKTIKQSIIYLILKQKYQEEFDNVQNFWKNTVNNQKFIEDLFYLKKKIVEEQWIGERMKQQKLNQKQQKIKLFLSGVKSKYEIKNRLKTLKDELSIAQNKINMAKNEDESVKLVKQYSQLKNQEIFLKNRKRRMLSLQEQRSAQSMSKSNISFIAQFQQKLDSLVNQNIRNKFIQDINQIKSSQKNTQNTNINEQIINPESKIKILKLQKFFDFFAKKEAKNSMLFGQILQAQKFISLENYLRMISSVDLDSLLTLQEKVKIFKINSNYYKRINFPQFINSLIQIARKSSDRLNVNLDRNFFGNFIEQFLQKANQNQRNQKYDSLKIHQNTNKGYLRKKQTKKYKLNIYPHTGKLVSNISQELIDRKKIKLQKYRKLKDLILSRKKSLYTTMTPVVQQQMKIQKGDKLSLKLIDIQKQQKQTIQSKTNKYRKNTYFSLYKNKVEYQNDKFSLQGDKKLYSSQFEDSEIAEQNRYSEKVSAFNHENDELKDLISFQEDDTFLTTHLQRKNNLLNNLGLGKRFQKIHF